MRAPAKKSLGQNFLTDPHHQVRIVAALEAAPGDHVVEIGPGHGALTNHLLERPGPLTLIELDDDIAAYWDRVAAQHDHVELRHQDALTVDFGAIASPGVPLRIIGNIPYNITSPLIFHLLESARAAAAIVLMIQREVADRILAEPGSRTYGALSVGVRAIATAERLFHVPRGAFRPAPNVDSTVIRIRPSNPFGLTPDDEVALRTLTRTCFSWRRKQLQKILREADAYRIDPDGIAALERDAFDLQARPESLAPREFIRLARALRALRS